MRKPKWPIWLALILIIALAAPAQAQEKRLDLGIITVRQKSLAEQLRQEISSGADFGELAKKHSVGPTASRGGKLGKVPLSKLRPEYREAVKDLQPGAPSNVVLTEGGFNILYIFPEVHTAPTPVSLPEASHTELMAPSSIDTTLPLHLQARQLFSQAMESLAAGDFARAKKLLTDTLAKYPQDQGAVLFMDALTNAEGSSKKQQAVRLLASGVIALQIGEMQNAINQYDKALENDPNLWEAKLLSANIMANLGSMEKALSLLDECIQINPKADNAYVSKGTISRELNKSDQAKQYLNEALNLNPKNAKAMYQLGAIALDEQNHKEAERYFKASLALDPYQFDAHNDLGLIYLVSGRLELAEAEYRESLAANPGFAPAHVNLGNLYAKQKKYNQAIDEYNKALDLDPTFGEAHNNLAASYVLLENWPMAIMHVDKALGMNFPVADVILRKVAPHRQKQ